MDRKAALAPLEFIVSALGGCMIVILVLVALGTFADDPPDGYVDPVCITGHVLAADETLLDLRPPILELSPDVTANTQELYLCDSSPSARQRWLKRAVDLPALLYPALILLLLWRLVRRARRSGFFVPEIALGVGRLGLFVLAWGLVVTALQAWAYSALVASMAPNDTVGYPSVYLESIMTPLLIGFGLLTVSRVLAQAVPMQHELDTTV